MKSLALSLVALAATLTGCANRHTASYLVSVHDRAHGTAVEGATVEARDGAHDVSLPTACGTTDGRGEAVILVPGWSGADLFITFDGETERYWFPPARTPRYDAPKDEIEGEQSSLRFIAGPSGTSVWRVTVVRVRDQIR